MRSAECGVRNAECGMRSAESSKPLLVPTLERRNAVQTLRVFVIGSLNRRGAPRLHSHAEHGNEPRLKSSLRIQHNDDDT